MAQRPAPSRNPDRADERRRALLVLPGLVFLLLIFLYPLGALVATSVYDRGFTLQHYQRLLTVPAYLKYLGAHGIGLNVYQLQPGYMIKSYHDMSVPSTINAATWSCQPSREPQRNGSSGLTT